MKSTLQIELTQLAKEKVMIMTGYGTRDSYLEAKALEASDFLRWRVGTGERRSILIVEDDISYRRALAKTFAKAGYQVTVAPDGQTALQLLEKRSFDLVLTDLKMPGKSGLDLLRALRNRRPRPKVMIMTGYGTRDSYLEAKALEASGFLLKPLSWDYLLWAVRESLNQHDCPEDRSKEG